MLMWQKILMLGTSLSAVGVSIVLKRMSPLLSRLIRIAAIELEGIPLLQTITTTKTTNKIDKKTSSPTRKKIVRIGILGAAKIAPPAMIWPSYHLRDSVEITAIAARNPTKAQRFANKYNIPIVHTTYKDLIEDPNIDAIYNPLPNGYHAYWTIQALKHNKHVLCEKPFASNAEEAQIMQQEASKRSRFILMEAFHYRFHPMMSRLQNLIEEHIPDIRHVEAKFDIPFYAFRRSDIRYNNRGQHPELAGGILMDAGCYAINFVRHTIGQEPTNVHNVSMVEIYPGVDIDTKATLEFPSSSLSSAATTTASIAVSAQSWFPLNSATIFGYNGKKIHIKNFIAPFIYHRIDIYNEKHILLDSHSYYENDNDENSTLISTYEYQLNAFVKAIQGDPISIQKIQEAGSPSDAVQNMKVIDMIYRAAGLEPRKGLSIS